MRLLVIDPAAEAVVARLAEAARGTDTTPAASREVAEAYLAGAAWDAVAIRDDQIGADALADLAGRLGASVHRYADEAALAGWLGGDGGDPAEAARAVLTDVRDRLADLAHSLNNPLAVISGHAQLGLEMARALPLTGDDATDLAASFEGVSTGARALAERLAELNVLRREIEQHLDRLGGASR